jgi:hypothetical protein
MVKLTDKVVVSPLVATREVGQETVLMDLSTGAYFGLDPIGERIWKLIEEGHTLVQICDFMLEEYQVERETLERDLLELGEARLDTHALEARGKTGADELHEQLLVHVPGAARQGVRQPEEACRLALHDQCHQQRRAYVQLREARTLGRDGEIPMTRSDDPLEYACHEGNYAS